MPRTRGPDGSWHIPTPTPTLTRPLLFRCLRWCCVVGSEDKGITAAVRAAVGSDARVRIWMRAGVDSLNIGVAAAVLLNGLREREKT